MQVTRLSATKDPHFVYSDIQLSISHSTLSTKNIDIDGENTNICFRRSTCQGIRSCPEDCSYVVSTRKKVNRCTVHRTEKKLTSSGEYPVSFVYMWPEDESDHRRWLTVLNLEQPGISHNHPPPAPHKIAAKVREDIAECFKRNPEATAKEIQKGAYHLSVVENGVSHLNQGAYIIYISKTTKLTRK